MSESTEIPTVTRKILLDSIEQNIRVQQVVSDEALRRTVGGIETLPAVPHTYHALLAAASSSGTSLDTIGRLVESDPAVSLKVLQLVNTAFFGSKRQTASIHQALSLLGIEMLKALVLTAHLFSAVAATRVPSFSLDLFQAYSMRIGRLARSFVTDPALADEAFTAGILHDIGKLVLALRMPAKFTQVIQRIAETGEDHQSVEREILGVGHAEVGAYLMMAWGIPTSIIESVAFHHSPAAVSSGNRKVLAAVHAADALYGIVSCGEPETRLDLGFIESVGLAGEVARWRAIVEKGDAT